MTKRQKLLGLLVEADMEAMEAGIVDFPMSRLHAEYIVDRLLEAEVLTFVKWRKKGENLDSIENK